MTFSALLNSALLAAGAAAIAVPLGALLAILIARFELLGSRLAAATLGVLLFLPLYVQLCGWDAAFGKLGWFSLATGSLADPLLAGMRGAIVVHGLAAAPWAALIVVIGLAQIDPAQEEAALLIGPPAFVLWRVTLPQVGPWILAAAIWTIVSTTSEMTVTNIFLINPAERTYTEQFYMTFSLSADAEEAALAALPGVAGLALLMAAALWMVGRCAPRAGQRSLAQQVTFRAGRAEAALSVLLWLVVGVLVAVPVVSLVLKAGFVVEQFAGERRPGWSAWAAAREVGRAPGRFAGEFGWTIVVAAGAATLALAAALPLGWLARRGGARALPAAIATVLGLVLPGPLIGVALIWLLNRDVGPALTLGGGAPQSWLLLLYDQTPLVPILAQAIRALPLATLLAWHAFRTLDPNVLAAAALDGATPWQTFRRIAWPLRRRAIGAAWIAAFAVAAGDLAWAHLVTPPGLDLIQRRVFGLVHSGVEEQVAAISLVTILAYVVLAGLALSLVSSASRRSGCRRTLSVAR